MTKTAESLALLNELDAIAVVLDRHGAVIEWTRGFHDLMGRSSDYLRGRPLWEFMSPHDRDGLRRMVIDSIDDRGSQQVAATVVAAAGPHRMIWASSVIERSDDTAVVAWATDATVELASPQQELAAVYEHTPGILFYVAAEPDGEFRFLSMSRSGLVATGLNHADVVGCLVRDVIPAPSTELVLKKYREAIRSGHTVRWEEESVYPAGRRVGEVAVTPLYDATGVATHLIGIVHDVTERQQHARDLQQREERLALLLRLNDALRPLDDLNEMLDSASRLLAEHLHANRVHYAEIHGDEFIIRHSYVDGVAPFDERGPVAHFGAAVGESFRRDKSVTVSDVRIDPRFTDQERAGLLATQIAAFTGVMIVKGQWVGACGVHSATPRQWTAAETQLVRDVAERTWEALERGRTRLALRAANDALRESEARFSVIFDRAPFAISLTSEPDGKIVSVNEAFERLFEFSREEVYGKTRVELGISTHSWNAALVDELERNRPVRELEVCRRTKSGAERVLLLSIDPIRIGERDFWLTTAIDVTEKRQTEAALREREARLRLALDASAAGSWTRDAGARHVEWDEGFRRLYGFPRDTPANFDAWLSRIHQEDLPKVLGLFDEMRHPTSETWDTEFRIVRPDGIVSWIQSIGRIERDAAGQVIRLAGLELDVTARRHAEEALHARRDEERARELQLLLEAVAQGIVSMDADGRILTANQAVNVMFGWTPTELIGQSIERLVPSYVRDERGTHHSECRDLMARRKDGSTFPIDFSLSHVATPDGGRAVAFITDITERRQAAAALQERTAELEHRTGQLRQLASDVTLAEQRAREQLAKTLHDGLQQLLVVAAMNLDQELQRSSPVGPLVQAKQHLDEAIAAARSLSFELYPPVSRSSGLPAILSWLADWVRSKYGLDVHVSVDPLADTPRADVRTLLFESVRELLFNIVKHAHVEQATVDLTIDGDGMVCIVVADHGIGFEPSGLVDRTKAGHVGWGLFSIRERLTLLGGRFEIDSTPGQGTRFRLLAPRHSTQDRGAASTNVLDDVERPVPPSDGDARSRTALRILLVDDHAAVRHAFRELLQSRPELCVVGDAANGLEAIAQARTLHPDVIMMDVLMPVMDGVEATRRLRAELPFVQIVGLSTQSRTEGLHPIEQAGALGFFTKGVDTQRLIDQLLAIHAASPSSNLSVRP